MALDSHCSGTSNTFKPAAPAGLAKHILSEAQLSNLRTHSQCMSLLHNRPTIAAAVHIGKKASATGYVSLSSAEMRAAQACAGVPEQDASSQALLLSVALLMVMREAAGEGVRGLDGPELTRLRTLESKFGASLPSATAPLIICIRVLGHFKVAADCLALRLLGPEAYRLMRWAHKSLHLASGWSKLACIMFGTCNQ